MNPYLEGLHTRYNALRDSMAEIQTRAATEKRDLTADELKLIEGQAEQATGFATQIQTLSAVETRSAEVATLAANVAKAVTGTDDTHTRNVAGGKVEPLTGSAQAKDRDPGFYTRSSKHSFFGDIYKRQTGNDDARERLQKHTRALDTAGEGVGIVAPKWMTEEFETLARQGRALANAVRNIDLGDDPRPMTLPKQTAGTDNVVAEQAAENDPVAGTDAWDSDVDVVAPKPTAGKQVVSRQMVDMSSPAIDQLIYGDLMAVYNLKVEKKVGAAMVAAAGAAVTTFATNAAFATGAASIDAIIDAAIAVRVARKLPPNIIAMTVPRWGRFKKLRDSDGRPLIPATSRYGPANVVGIGEVAVDGEIEGFPALGTEGVGDGVTYPESILVARSTDTLLFESNVLRFRFEEQAGPESVVLGIWGYTAVIVRQAGKSVKRVVITAA